MTPSTPKRAAGSTPVSRRAARGVPVRRSAGRPVPGPPPGTGPEAPRSSRESEPGTGLDPGGADGHSERLRSRTPGDPEPGRGEPDNMPSPRPGQGQEAIAAAMTEDRGRDSLDAHVRRLIRDLGLMAYHTRDSRRSAKGYPDWTIAGPSGQIWRELKTQRGRLTREQQEWLDLLAAGGGNAKVWRPADLLSGQVARELTAISRIGATAWTA